MKQQQQPYFRDRTHAGQQLIPALAAFAQPANTIVLGLPRGGVPVAYEIAHALSLPLDICLVRKLGVPDHKELAMGAIALGGRRILNQRLISELAISEQVVDQITAQEYQELKRRERAYRGEKPRLDLQGRTVILVDDGIATGASIQVAVMIVRSQQPQQIIVAVPVAPAPTCQALAAKVDQVVCLSMPDPFHAIGLWYDNFSQTTDAQVRDLLARQSSP